MNSRSQLIFQTIIKSGVYRLDNIHVIGAL